ncbi:hypothetical protein JMX53_02745 [Cutibacterium avidum]|nr:hypothetical protein [Cutibacterium avidum]QQY15512.1 hypothetical protein JMX53_02745 [Cutibacterium avidum]
MSVNTNKRYPAELRTRAVRMYPEIRPKLEQPDYAVHTPPQKELELSHH